MLLTAPVIHSRDSVKLPLSSAAAQLSQPTVNAVEPNPWANVPFLSRLFLAHPLVSGWLWPAQFLLLIVISL